MAAMRMDEEEGEEMPKDKKAMKMAMMKCMLEKMGWLNCDTQEPDFAKVQEHLEGTIIGECPMTMDAELTCQQLSEMITPDCIEEIESHMAMMEEMVRFDVMVSV